MPDLAFQSQVVTQVLNQLAGGGNALAAKILASPGLSQAATLGALGPDLLRYRPPTQSTLQAVQSALASISAGSISQTAIVTALESLTNAQQQELFLNPLGVVYASLFGQLVSTSGPGATGSGFWPLLSSVNGFLAQLNAAVQSGDELNLVPLLGEISTFVSNAQALATIAGALQAAIPTVVLGMALGPAMDVNPLFAAIVTGDNPISPQADRPHEFLKWHAPGQFAANLFAQAAASGDDTQLAYAFGWLCAYAASITAQPFINTVSEGPYRTHWWRTRLVANYVDAWTFGFFSQNPLPQAQGSIDNFVPAYDAWPPITTSNLQTTINVGGLAEPSQPDGVPDALTHMGWGDQAGLRALPGQLPAGIANVLVGAVNATYTGTLPQPPAALTDPQTFADGYLGSYAVFWFLTSGSGPYSTVQLGDPPCTEPSWISGVISGSGSLPSPQAAGLNTTNTVIDILLLLLALFEALAGDFAGAAATVATALALPVVNFPVAQCNVFWLIDTLNNVEQTLQEFLTLLAIGYPAPAQLGVTSVDAQNQTLTLPATDWSNNQQLPGLLDSLASGSLSAASLTSFASLMPASAGRPLCRVGPLLGSKLAYVPGLPYPAFLDTRSSIAAIADLNYPFSPLSNTAANGDPENVTPLETEPTLGLLLPDPASVIYPDAIMNGLGLNAGGLLGNAPSLAPTVAFGDAVANAAAVVSAALASGGQDFALPDYNLDGDRGYGWATWNPAADPFTTQPVIPVPES